MNTTTPRCLLTWITTVLLVLGVPRGRAADVDAQIKRIAARVSAVEMQLDRAVFYEQKTEDAAAGSSLSVVCKIKACALAASPAHAAPQMIRKAEITALPLDGYLVEHNRHIAQAEDAP